ncbi:MAG: YraN family protein [Cyclobacteriaceae bacterium]
MAEHIETGSQGERLAAEFLKKKGYEIVVQNYRHKHSEIDLIVKTETLLVFVEVKTRSSSSFGEPETFVDSKKAARIFEGAEQYMVDNHWSGNIRFDIVAVKTGVQTEIVHFEDAFH